MMDCKEFALLLDKPEAEWSERERSDAQAHAARCADCAMLLTMRREMRAMDAEEQVPPGFTASWKNALETEANKTMSSKSLRWLRAISAVAAVAVLAVGTTAVYLSNEGPLAKTARQESGVYEEPEYEEAYEMDYAMEAAPMLTTGSTASAKRAAGNSNAYSMTADVASDAGVQESKIIRTVNISIQTRDYQRDCDAARQLADAFGGRIESFNMSGDGSAASLRWASFTMRIPTDRLDGFISDARGVGTVTYFSESSTDVSESYYDTQSRLNTQQVKLDRLTELMEKAENVSDLVELENAIGEAQYWIDYYTGQIKGYDSRIDDSYVYIDLHEVSNATAAENRQLSLGERIVNAVKASVETAGDVLQAMVIFLIAALPWIAALAVVIVLVCVIVRRVRKRKGLDKA